MASNGGELDTDLLSSSPFDEHHLSPRSNFLTSPRNQTSESSEKSDNSLSDVEENVPREVELSEQYGRTPPSSRSYTKPSRERTRRKKDKASSELRKSPSLNLQKRRQSASATSSERAFNRSLKEEESSVFVNGCEEKPFKPRHRSMTESSLSRKPSQRKYQCIRYKEPSSNVVNNVHFKEGKAAVCPLERVKFYDTMNMLINLGQGGNADGKESIVEETENYEIEELREALWLELQAWRNSSTMLDQDEWLMNERKKINNILDNVIFFNVDKTVQVNFDVLSSDSESEFEDEEGCCLLHPSYAFPGSSPSSDTTEINDLAYFDETKLSTSSDISGTISIDEETYKLSDFAQTIKKAVKVVTSTLNKLYSVEQLYPSRGALSKDFKKYGSENFQASCDTLVLWLNQIKGLYHKLYVMSQLVHVDFDDEKVWGDWIELGIDLHYLKTHNNCRNCQDLNSHYDFETQESFEGFKRGLSSENTSTSRYRPFVDQNIKKMGVACLGYKLHQLIHMELARASYILQVDKSTSVFLKHQSLHKVYKNMLMRKIENFPFDKMIDPDDATTYAQTFGIPTEDWIERFQKMGLPSFDRLYVFLVRVVMDIYHECLRMRMEHRPKGEPSSLSVRQLLEECKEVLLAAVVVRQYFLDALEGLGKDLSSSTQFEQRVLEFDHDIQKMLEVYFEYLHNFMHMLQQLPEASCGARNILEEEWEFVREITPYIRGGEVQAGKRFCVMARGLVESTADFLVNGMDEYFSGLHDLDNNEKHWVKVLQSCRDFKKLFKETRERSIKALGFVKRLRADLGVAATFHVNVPYSRLLDKLKSSGYIQVVTKLNISVLMFVRHSLQESRSCIIELLNACCGLHSQSSACAKGMNNYIVLVSEKKTEGFSWNGEQVNITPALDTSLGLVDIQVDELAIVACTSHALNIHIGTFKSHMDEAVTCASGLTSCHLDLIDMKTQISESLVNLRTKVCDALDGAIENLDVEKMYDIEENERNRLNRSTLEALQFAFNAVFDFHREMRRIPESDEESLAIVGKYYLELASKWMDFVLKRCEKGRGSRPRWSGQGMKFLVEAIHPTISCRLSQLEFEKLQREINKCVDHVVGSADNLMNSSSPGGQMWSPNSKFSRSSTFPGTHSHVHPSRTISEPGRPTIKRANTMGNDTGEEHVDNEAPQRRMVRVQESVALLEYARQTSLFEKHIIGRVSNKKRDLAGELAVIPKRVPFKWQRGNKIGEGQFGKVYSCVNLDTEEVVAMKQITFHPNDHSAFQDLADEIKAFEGLAHDSLVKYYGCEVHRDVMYIFMEYCGDGTISDVSKLGLPEAMIRKYADQILIAVEFLHDRGIVHRDIKGPNIFLSSEGLIKLGDFGASVKLVNPSQTMCGEVSTLRGTIAYMAPEVIRESGYGRAADIWSVGCVVVEMATGKPPWSEFDNQWTIMLKVGEGASPAIPECLSDEGKDFLMHCFVHDPHERDTARQLQNHTFLKV